MAFDCNFVSSSLGARPDPLEIRMLAEGGLRRLIFLQHPLYQASRQEVGDYNHIA